MTFTYKFVFVWYVEGKRIRSSEVEGNLEEVQMYYALALNWMEAKQGREVKLFSPGNFKTRPAGLEMIEWFRKQRTHEARMQNYTGD